MESRTIRTIIIFSEEGVGLNTLLKALTGDDLPSCDGGTKQVTWTSYQEEEVTIKWFVHGEGGKPLS